MSETLPPLLFPIGHYCGVLYTSTGHDHLVRRGGSVRRLSDEKALVWGLAHGLPDQVGERPWTRLDVETAAARAGIADPTSAVDELRADNLLAEVVPGTDAAVEFAGTVRLLALMVGLGNTAEQPWLFQVGPLGRPVAGLTAPIYQLYRWAALAGTLWDACASNAAAQREAGVTDPDAVDPHRTLTALLGELHTLLCPHAAALDAALA